jgi:hypothetical protein
MIMHARACTGAPALDSKEDCLTSSYAGRVPMNDEEIRFKDIGIQQTENVSE